MELTTSSASNAKDLSPTRTVSLSNFPLEKEVLTTALFKTGSEIHKFNENGILENIFDEMYEHTFLEMSHDERDIWSSQNTTTAS